MDFCREYGEEDVVILGTLLETWHVIKDTLSRSLHGWRMRVYKIRGATHETYINMTSAGFGKRGL
jgi:hypothetical protein